MCIGLQDSRGQTVVGGRDTRLRGREPPQGPIPRLPPPPLPWYIAILPLPRVRGET